MKTINYLSIILILLSLLVGPQKVNSKDLTIMKTNIQPLIKYTTQKEGVKEFYLPNGLKILLKENHSIPLLTFSVWYKVGSRNEIEGIRGIAHFLEHMMFKGTKKYKKGEISEIIQRHGGIFNAFTSNDCTTYYETISPQYLEKVIEIESDRMKGSLIREEELNLERTVVLSELEGNLNNPTTLLDDKLRATAYEVSPYKHPTIGYESDLKNIDSNLMHDFYKRFYNPKNATIVLVGDFNEKKALELIERYFSIIKNGPSLSNPNLTNKDKPQKKEKRFTVKRAGSFKMVEIAFHIPDAKDKDIYPLNIIEEILIKGEKSILKKTLIETGLATEVYGGAELNTDPGLFYILVSLTPKATHKKVEKIILSEIDNLIKASQDEKEILAAKNRIKASYLFNLDGTLQKALNIGYFEIVNNWKESSNWTDKISKVTSNQVSNVLKTYFQKKNRTIGYFIPEMNKGDKYEAQPLGLSRTQHFLTPKEQSSRFNFENHNLKEGSKLLIYKNIDLPVTYISGVIKGGSSLLPKENEWDCEVIVRTLEKGTKNYTKEQIEDILDTTGSIINFSCDEESVKFNLASLNENLIQTIKLFTDLLINPIFPKNEIDKEIDKLTAEIIESKDDTQEIAKKRFNQILYTKDHPYYSNNFEEDIKLVKKINNKILINEHEKIIKNNKIIFSVVSNLNDKELNKAIITLEEKISISKEKIEKEVNIPDTLLRDTPKKESAYVQDKMQSDVYLGHAGYLKRTDPDFYKVYIANYILGGSSLSSRLSKKVRDNAGLVYTIYSYINASHGKGEFGIYFGANNDKVDKALELIKEELNKFTEYGITEVELQEAKKSLIDSFISRNLSTNRNIANTLLGIEFYKLGDDYIDNYPQIINSLKLKEVNLAIKKYILPDKLNIAIAGEYK